MAFKKNQGPTEEEKEIDPGEIGNKSTGQKRYGRLVRMFREGYVSVCIYQNVFEKQAFHDVVIFRKIKMNGYSDYKRGANLKPSDIPDLLILLKEVEDYFKSIDANT
jgi:hypothetical protein